MIDNQELIAHWRSEDGKAQELIVHLHETSQYAQENARKVGLAEIGKIMGLLHDLGKASQEYQSYLKTYEGLISPDEDGYSHAKRGEIDHSTAGAQIAYQKMASRGREGKVLAQAVALAIASHHSGLIDCLKPEGMNNFQRRMDKSDEETHLSEAINLMPSITHQVDELLKQPLEKLFLKKLIEMKESNESEATLPFKHGLLVRFLLSCLLDADRLSTADFENPQNELARNYGKYLPWSVLVNRLEKKFDDYAHQMAMMKPGNALEVNRLRNQVAEACLDFSQKPKGVYQLTVPTGGGKTLASLRFALHHAEKHKMDRVFYIVPFITIIDQNADKVREILEDTDKTSKFLANVVLEHHSNLTPEKETRRHNLLAENWDAPIVFTTQVQFLETLFGSGTRDARRIHQLANSVIIFDEVQTIPVKMTNLFTTALRFLVHDCGATVVLCTATQPPFDKIENYRKLNITPDQHIIQNERELFEKLKRVEVHDERKPGGHTDSEIANLTEYALNENGSVLIVVNTRASAQAIYHQIKDRKLAATFHLSTNMCAAHRLDVLAKIKVILDAKKPVICVSTQLIEAGVDIDFGAVIRSLAGLDSITQSGGRCNRHGLRQGYGNVWVVNLQNENLGQLQDIKIAQEKAQTVMDDFKESPEIFENDLIGLNAIAKYYNYYYGQRQSEMNYNVSPNSSVGRADDLFNLLSTNTISMQIYQRNNKSLPDIVFRQSFQSAARAFHVIDSITRGVVVPYRDGEEIIKDLCGAFSIDEQTRLLKKAQRFSVNLFNHQFDKLLEKGAIHEVQEGTGIYYLEKQYHSDEFGWRDETVGNIDLLCI